MICTFSELQNYFTAKSELLRELEINNMPDTKNVGWVERSATHRTRRVFYFWGNP
ncbi:Uncharacterized protein dnm_061240 [Desulfonema magnum]|uniref:Uncharacterized protein n=1 Tax=Desulfonema magnum TaxID=45655 RepID=A0A975BRI0_9BACT|nr:Uncharacterized protein dnm_061240 [Desulfonema magnum]